MDDRIWMLFIGATVAETCYGAGRFFAEFLEHNPGVTMLLVSTTCGMALLAGE